MSSVLIKDLPGAVDCVLPSTMKHWGEFSLTIELNFNLRLSGSRFLRLSVCDAVI